MKAKANGWLVVGREVWYAKQLLCRIVEVKARLVKIQDMDGESFYASPEELHPKLVVESESIPYVLNRGDDQDQENFVIPLRRKEENRHRCILVCINDYVQCVVLEDGKETVNVLRVLSVDMKNASFVGVTCTVVTIS